MFTGIIETIGKVVAIEDNGVCVDFVIQSAISSQLKIDQSVSHNGACLTAVSYTHLDVYKRQRLENCKN